MIKIIKNIMGIIPKFIKNLCKITITYICIIFCIKCRDNCLDNDNDKDNIEPINSNDNINYNSTDINKDNNNKENNKKHYPILESYENKIKEKLENSNI